MVDPDEIGAIKGNGIATPRVLVVQVGHRNVLDDDIAPATHPHPLTLDGGGASDSDDNLVTADIYRLTGSLVPHRRR